VLITLRKLRHYFQEYSISVVTDNKAEYEALLHGLRLATSLGIK
jgi:ribonuclease HI